MGTIGEKLFILRKTRGFSQEELAEKVGVSRQAVHKWETDKSLPSAKKIKVLCELFGVTAEYFFAESNTEEISVGKTEVVTTKDTGAGIEKIVAKQVRKTSLLKSVIVFGIILSFALIAFIIITKIVFSGNTGDSFVRGIDIGYFWLILIITSVLFITETALSIAFYVVCKSKSNKKKNNKNDVNHM